MKKILTFILACTLFISGSVFAQEKNPDKDGFKAQYAKVVETADGSDYGQILVEDEKSSEDKETQKMFLYTKDILKIDLKTGEVVKDHKFSKGEKIQYFYKNNTPVMMSYPAKMTPDVIGINAEDPKFSLDVDHFDKDGRGVSNRLVIKVDENTDFQNLMGEKVEPQMDSDLAVLYTVATRSLPPITNPDKVLVLNINDKVVNLSDYKLEDKDLFYLRKYYEALGAKIEWNNYEHLTKISIGDKSVEIKNSEAKLQIADKVVDMDGFVVEDGTSYISEKNINEINEYLLNK